MTFTRVQGSKNWLMGDAQAVYVADGANKELRRDKLATVGANLADSAEYGVRAVVPNGTFSQTAEGLKAGIGWTTAIFKHVGVDLPAAFNSPLLAIAATIVYVPLAAVGAVLGLVVGVVRDVVEVFAAIWSFFKNLADILVVAFRGTKIEKAEDLGVKENDFALMKSGDAGVFDKYDRQVVRSEKGVRTEASKDGIVLREVPQDYVIYDDGTKAEKKSALEKAGACMGFTFLAD